MEDGEEVTGGKVGQASLREMGATEKGRAMIDRATGRATARGCSRAPGTQQILVTTLGYTMSSATERQVGGSSSRMAGYSLKCLQQFHYFSISTAAFSSVENPVMASLQWRNEKPK